MNDCPEAKESGAAVRDLHPGPIEIIIYCRATGDWRVAQVSPSHALHMAEKLIEGARLRLAPLDNRSLPTPA